MVDTLGLLLIGVVHAANIQESDGAKLVLHKARGRFPRLRKIWVDQGYKAHVVAWAQALREWMIEVVTRPPGTKGFRVLPRRWVVERTFAWLGRSRRLSKDYEGLPETSEAWLHVAMIHLMLKRLAPAYPLLGQALSIVAANCEREPTSFPFQGGDCAPAEGAIIVVTTSGGELVGTCVAEAADPAVVVAGCSVSVPAGSTVIVTEDVSTIPPGYAPTSNPQPFDVPATPPDGAFGGPVFLNLPAEHSEPDASDDPAGGVSRARGTATDSTATPEPTPVLVTALPVFARNAGPRHNSAPQQCQAGTLTGGYMADAGAAGLAFLSLVQTGDTLGGYFLAVKPDDQGGTVTDSASAQGAVVGDAVTITFVGPFGFGTTLTGRADGCRLVLTWADESGQVATGTFEPATEDAFNRAVQDWQQELATASQAQATIQATATAEAAYRTQTDQRIRDLSDSLAAQTAALNDATSWFPGQVEQLRGDLGNVQAAVGDAEDALERVRDQAAIRPMDCYRMGKVLYEHGQVTYERSNVTYRESNFDITGGELERVLSAGPRAIADARETARALDEAIAASPYPLPAIGTLPGAELSAITAHDAAAKAAREDLDAIRIEYAQVVAEADDISARGEAVVEDAQSGADCGERSTEPIEPTQPIATATGANGTAKVAQPAGDRTIATVQGRAWKIADMLPTEDEVPVGLVPIEEGKRTADEITATFPDPGDAASRFAGWGWEGNAFRRFGVPDGTTPPPDRTASIDVSIHRFGSTAAAAEALRYLVDARMEQLRLRGVPVDALGDRALALAGPTGGGNEATIYLQRRDVLMRITVVSLEGDPMADAVATTRTILAKVD